MPKKFFYSFTKQTVKPRGVLWISSDRDDGMGGKIKTQKNPWKKLTPKKWFPWSIIITWILVYPLGCYVPSTTEIQLCNLILLSMLLCTVYHASKRFYKTFLFSCYSWMKQHQMKICKIYFKRILPWRYVRVIKWWLVRLGNITLAILDFWHVYPRSYRSTTPTLSRMFRA